MREVPGSGPSNANIAIVGEAPGVDEEREGLPFIGKAGTLLTTILSSVGIDRTKCYITNVVKYRPPDNKINRLHEVGMTIEQFLPQLKDEITSRNPNVIFALGNTALEALTGKSGITKWRGSILSSSLIAGKKVIASIHPSSIQRGGIEDLPLLQIDAKRVLNESKFPDFRSVPSREYILNPSYSELLLVFERLKRERFLTVDIEAIPGTSIITEVGLGTDKWVITIPIYYNKPVWSVEQECHIWDEINFVLASPYIYKIIQNEAYEQLQLSPWIGEVYPVYLDTMIGIHLCYPELDKDLDTIASIFSYEPHWKSDRNAPDYNAKDVAATHESAMNLVKELEEFNLVPFLHGYQQPFAAIMHRAGRRGILVDKTVQKAHKDKALSQVIELEKILYETIGHELNVDSPKQVQQLLYIELGLPIQRKRAGGAVTADEDAINKLKAKFNLPALNLIIEIRRLNKAISTYLSDRIISPDGRMRTDWVITGTKFGRLSSRKNAYGEGCNLQNIPQEFRDIFISDPGCSFVIGDESQVEARFVAWLSGDPTYKRLFQLGGDIHRRVAAWIFKTDPEVITDEQRRRAKATAHGAPYGIGSRRIAEMYGISEKEGEWLREQYFVMFPDVKNKYQEGIKRRLYNARVLISPFNRRCTFFGWLNEDTFRAAYSSIPQGSAADTINMAATRMQYQLPDGTELFIQCHDEVVFQCKDEDIEKVCTLFENEMSIPILVNGDYLTIPIDISIGKTWLKEATVKWHAKNYK